MSKKFIVKRIKMKDIKSVSDLLDLFVYVAKNNPNQATKLFNRYVADIRRHHYSFEKSRFIASRNLRMLADSRDADVYELLMRTVPGMRR